MKILSVVGARPNFVKIAPILHAIERSNSSGAARHLGSVLVHTEQHYDDAMSAAFFSDLRIPRPQHTLGVGSGSHAVQTAEVMRRFEPVLLAERPDIILVVGDVNSTVACALTAAKLQTPIAHVEAGLRSFDRTMPEEINRIVTDALSNYLFTTEESANVNLKQEGHPPEHVFFVGNVMIDSLLAYRTLAQRSTIRERLGLGPGQPYALVTLHRPANVDNAATLAPILGALNELAQDMPVLFPAHPRTRARIMEFGLGSNVQPLVPQGATVTARPGRVTLLEPVGYLDFLRLMSDARLVLTDSGGIQEESTCVGVPCVTIRENTERPVTLTAGTNVLAGTDPANIIACAQRMLRDGARSGALPPLWDGHAAERIVQILLRRI